jgi:hypothetical protein
MARKTIFDIEAQIAQLKARKADLERKQAALAKKAETQRLLGFARFMESALDDQNAARTAAEWWSAFSLAQVAPTSSEAAC